MIDKSVQSIIDFLVFSGKYQIIVHFYIKIRLSFTVIIGRQLLFISQRLYYIDFLHVLFQFGEQQADIYVFTIATLIIINLSIGAPPSYPLTMYSSPVFLSTILNPGL